MFPVAAFGLCLVPVECPALDAVMNSDFVEYAKDEETLAMKDEEAPPAELTRSKSRNSRFGGLSRNASNNAATKEFDRAMSYSKSKESKTKSIFEWNSGGRNVYIMGSWDNFNQKLPMESVRPGAYRIVLPIPSNERCEYKFLVDGVERVAEDLPRILNEMNMLVNVKHPDPTVSSKSGKVRKILSKIRGVDMYSPLEGRHFASMLLFRFFYLATIPSAGYYFYWLIAVGGNFNHPFIWIVRFSFRLSLTPSALCLRDLTYRSVLSLRCNLRRMSSASSCLWPQL